MAQAFSPQRGTLPVLQYCPPAQLEVDPSYQRSVATSPSRRLIQQIARDWDWGLCQPLVVSRRADGHLFIVDGQHRRDAAALRGDIGQLPCVIVDHGNAAGEARAFVALNVRRRPLTAMQLFVAALGAEDKDAQQIAAIITGAGLRLTGAADVTRWKPGWINCIVTIQRVYGRHGARVLRLALDALATGFDAQVLRYCGTLFDAIVPLVSEEKQLNTWLLTQVLRGADQEQWMKDFAKLAAEEGKDRKAAGAAVIASAYREASIEAEAA